MFRWRTHTHSERAFDVCYDVDAGHCRVRSGMSVASFDIQLSCAHHVILEREQKSERAFAFGASKSIGRLASASDRMAGPHKTRFFFSLDAFIILLFFFGIFFVLFARRYNIIQFRLQQLQRISKRASEQAEKKMKWNEMFRRTDSATRIRSPHRMILVNLRCYILRAPRFAIQLVSFFLWAHHIARASERLAIFTSKVNTPQTNLLRKIFN